MVTDANNVVRETECAYGDAHDSARLMRLAFRKHTRPKSLTHTHTHGNRAQGKRRIDNASPPCPACTVYIARLGAHQLMPARYPAAWRQSSTLIPQTTIHTGSIPLTMSCKTVRTSYDVYKYRLLDADPALVSTATGRSSSSRQRTIDAFREAVCFFTALMMPPRKRRVQV